MLREEMRHVLEFLRWKATWWLSQGNLRSDDKVLVEGLCAYAHVQADLQLSLVIHFRSIWQKPLQEVDDIPRQHGPTPHDIQFTMPAANEDEDEDKDEDEDEDEELEDFADEVYDEDVVDDGNIYV